MSHELLTLRGCTVRNVAEKTVVRDGPKRRLARGGVKKRAELIEEIERQLQTETRVETVFTLRWTLADAEGKA